jgi:hypothetical protein
MNKASTIELIVTRASGIVAVFQLIVVILVHDEALIDMVWSYHTASRALKQSKSKSTQYLYVSPLQ